MDSERSRAGGLGTPECVAISFFLFFSSVSERRPEAIGRSLGAEEAGFGGGEPTADGTGSHPHSNISSTGSCT